MRNWVITTGKGEVWITLHHSSAQALTVFHRKFPGVEVASVVEAEPF